MRFFFFLATGAALAGEDFPAFTLAQRAFAAAFSFARCAAENPGFLVLTTGAVVNANFITSVPYPEGLAVTPEPGSAILIFLGGVFLSSRRKLRAL